MASAMLVHIVPLTLSLPLRVSAKSTLIVLPVLLTLLTVLPANTVVQKDSQQLQGVPIVLPVNTAPDLLILLIVQLGISVLVARPLPSRT